MDYFIVSSNLFQSESRFKVVDRSESVHFPLSCCLTFNMLEQSGSNERDDNSSKTYKKFMWRENLKTVFKNNFSTFFESMRESILIKLDISIDECVQSIVEMYHKAAECMKSKPSKTNVAKQEPWWDGECDKLKKEKFKALRLFRTENNYQHLNNYKVLRNRFKDVCRQKKQDYQKRNRDELVASRSNMNLFWRTVKKFRFKKPSISNAIKPEQWISHFKDLLNIPNLGILAETVYGFREDGAFNDAFNEPFTMSELQSSIKSL